MTAMGLELPGPLLYSFFPMITNILILLDRLWAKDYSRKDCVVQYDEASINAPLI